MQNDFKFYPRQRYEFLKDREEDIAIETKEVEAENIEETPPQKVVLSKKKT